MWCLKSVSGESPGKGVLSGPLSWNSQMTEVQISAWQAASAGEETEEDAEIANVIVLADE
jgi:hypothetical protein